MAVEYWTCVKFADKYFYVRYFIFCLNERVVYSETEPYIQKCCKNV